MFKMRATITEGRDDPMKGKRGGPSQRGAGERRGPSAGEPGQAPVALGAGRATAPSDPWSQYSFVSTASTIRACGFEMIVPATRSHTTRIAASKASASLRV